MPYLNSNDYINFKLNLSNLNFKITIMGRFLILFLLALLLISPAYAATQEYYADVQIRVFPTGDVEVSGTTNYPALSPGVTQNFTSKSGNLWTLNMTFPDTFSEYVYDLSFPANAQISYMNVPKNVRMETQGEVMHIIATGTNQAFFAVVQYSLGTPPSPPLPLDPIIILGISALATVIAITVYLRWRKRIQDKKFKLTYNSNAVTDRQKQIIDIIKREGGHSTQSKIQKETGIPKASLSRNIDSLVKKNIIKKERKGMTMVLYFSEE